MAIYRSIQMTFWTDSKIVDNFTPEDRYFYLYLLTNPHTNLSGCYEISHKQMSDETGYTKEVIERLLDRMEKVHDVIRFSKATKEILILNWSKFNWTSSKDFQKPLIREINNIKDADFKGFLQQKIDGVQTVLTPSYDGAGTTVTVTDNNNSINNINSVKDLKPKDSYKIFIPPTVSEVREYCLERHNNIDAECFVDFYTGKGWMIGKNKIKDWKACVRTWEKNRENKSSYTPKPNQFQQFTQRERSEMDFDELERKKLGGRN